MVVAGQAAVGAILQRHAVDRDGLARAGVLGVKAASRAHAQRLRAHQPAQAAQAHAGRGVAVVGFAGSIGRGAQGFRADAAGRVAGVAEGVVAPAVAVAQRDARRRHRLAGARVLVGEGKAAPAERVATEQGARIHHRRASRAQAAVVGLAHRRTRHRQVRFTDGGCGAGAAVDAVVARIGPGQAQAGGRHDLGWARVFVSKAGHPTDVADIFDADHAAEAAAADVRCRAGVVGFTGHHNAAAQGFRADGGAQQAVVAQGVVASQATTEPTTYAVIAQGVGRRGAAGPSVLAVKVAAGAGADFLGANEAA